MAFSELPDRLDTATISGPSALDLAGMASPSRGLILGVTGGIGSGKSTVTRVLAEVGAHVADADKLGHELLNLSTEAGRQIAARFPVTVDQDGQIDRASLAAAVFGDSQAVADLNAITHPRIRDRARGILLGLGPGQLGVYDAALIIEAGMQDLVDALVVVTAPLQRRLELLERYRGMTRQQAQARIGHQMSDAERISYADVVVYNYGSLEQLHDTVRNWAIQLQGALTRNDSEGQQQPV